MRARAWSTSTILALAALAHGVPTAAQQVVRPVAVTGATALLSSAISPIATFPVHAARPSQAPGRRVPRWVGWGLVGAAAGALTFPLLGSMASDSESHPARDATVGALGGFVIVGGSIALWDAMCRGDTRSRRAGLCGRP